jgi:HEAT repeat protein
LQDEQAPPATSLAYLSSAPDDEFARFSSLFPTLSIQRRRDVIDILGDLTEDNVELTFEPVFILGLDDPDVQVRSESIRALWDFDDAAFARKLMGMLDDAEALVRGAAALGLGHFMMRAELSDEDTSLTNEIEAALRGLYYDDSQLDEVRGRALESVGVRSHDWVAEMIGHAYESGNSRLKISAVHAMGRSADPAWLPTIYDEMLSEDSEMRFEAATAAGEIGDEEAVDSLSELTADDDPEVQEAAIAALGAIGGEAVKSVLQSLATEHDDERVQEAVADALATAEFLDDPMAFKMFLDRQDADDLEETESDE